MVKKNITIRIDPELKEQATALFKELGLNLSTATEIFYQQALQCNGFPFDVKHSEPNKTTYDAMKAADKDEDMYGPFNTVSDMMKALNE